MGFGVNDRPLVRACLAVAALASAFGMGVQTVRAQTEGASTSVQQPSPPLVLKRRIAIGRFSNATLYGRALLLPGEMDPLADQAADMLAARLVESEKFIVLERRDMDAIKSEQDMAGGGSTVGADTILIGSVTQFGRRVEGKTGFLNSNARQVASATALEAY